MKVWIPIKFLNEGGIEVATWGCQKINQKKIKKHNPVGVECE